MALYLANTVVLQFAFRLPRQHAVRRRRRRAADKQPHEATPESLDQLGTSCLAAQPVSNRTLRLGRSSGFDPGGQGSHLRASGMKWHTVLTTAMFFCRCCMDATRLGLALGLIGPMQHVPCTEYTHAFSCPLFN